MTQYDDEYLSKLDVENERLRERVKHLEFERAIWSLLEEDMKNDIARLREALKPFADCDVWEGYKDEETFVSGLKIGDLRAARAAMGESDERRTTSV